MTAGLGRGSAAAVPPRSVIHGELNVTHGSPTVGCSRRSASPAALSRTHGRPGRAGRLAWKVWDRSGRSRGQRRSTWMRRIVIGMTGATGAIYGVRLLEHLRLTPDVETHLIISGPGKRTVVAETDFSVRE